MKHMCSNTDQLLHFLSENTTIYTEVDGEASKVVG
jgi:hypothetical protein